ncbi:MAG: hypothetical protein ACJ8GJ_23595 [Vitreoscilla sp.]
MKQTLSPVLSAIALALAAGSAHAQIVNGQFTGLAGWATAGDAASVSVGGNHLVLTNAWSDGSDDGDGVNRNVSGSNPWPAGGGAGSLEQFIGVAGGAFDPDPASFVQAIEGSAALQTFSAAAGSRLSFRWDLVTTQVDGDATLADAAFVVIDGQVTLLANTLAAGSALGGGDYASETGWAGWSTTLAGSGTHTIAFGVVDVGSAANTSALNVTDVSLSAVPEAPVLAMFGAGLGLLALCRRRARS